MWDFAGRSWPSGKRRKRARSTASAYRGHAGFPTTRMSFAENLLRRRDDDTRYDLPRRRPGASAALSFSEVYDQPSRKPRPARLRAAGVGERAIGSPATCPNMPEDGDRHARYHERRRDLERRALRTSACAGSWTASARSSPGCCLVPTAISTTASATTRSSAWSEIAVPDAVARAHRGGSLHRGRRAGAVDACAARHHAGGLRLGAGAGATSPSERLPFDHPVFIMYSSGTTGVSPSASSTAPAAPCCST